MVITDCPWCDGPAVVADTLDCEGCALSVELDDEDAPLARAA